MHHDMPYICLSAKEVSLCPSSDWSEVPGEQTRLARAEQAMMMVVQPIHYPLPPIAAGNNTITVSVGHCDRIAPLAS